MFPLVVFLFLFGLIKIFTCLNLTNNSPPPKNLVLDSEVCKAVQKFFRNVNQCPVIKLDIDEWANSIIGSLETDKNRGIMYYPYFELLRDLKVLNVEYLWTRKWFMNSNKLQKKLLKVALMNKGEKVFVCAGDFDIHLNTILGA